MIEKILPAIITIIGNIIFYLWVKSRVDKSIEKNKIAYSGIFKEKVNIYRELLNRTYYIEKALSQFQYSGDEMMANEIMQTINEFIQYYTINQPFLSENMIKDLNNIRSEFQEIFESFEKQKSNKTSESLADFFKAGNKLKGNSLSDIKSEILLEMKSDLKIKDF